MSYNSFTNADKLTQSFKPAVVSYRSYGSTGAWTTALFANAVQYNATREVTDITYQDVGISDSFVSAESVEISWESGRVFDLNAIAALSGGLYALSTVAGTLVEDEEYVASSGAWSFDKFILLPGQNASGAKQTIASVVGSVDGALVLDTDYFQVKLDEVGWGIYIIDSTTVTTEAQNITITYDYTPVASTVLKTGGVKIISPIELKFETRDANDKPVTYIFYKVNPSGTIGHGFTGENEATPATIPLTFTAVKDTSREVNDQLYTEVRGS